MKCPECMKEGKRSIITEGLSATNVAYTPTQWDEDGKRIAASSKSTTWTSYTCSNGHDWSEES